jgi:hypothetical protein
MATDLAAHYEQLRSEALSCSAGHGLGLVLFLREGMLAWMRAWCRCAQSPNPEPPPASCRDEILPPEVRNEITTVLAAMILGQQEGVFCAS